MTPAQRGIWIGHQLADDKALYNTAECLELSGKVDASLLARAVALVVHESECLRAHYREGGLVPARVEPELTRHPLQGSWEWALTEDLATPFDLENGLPLRFALLEGAERDAVYLAAHHVALDGFGYALVWDRLAAVYAALSTGRAPPSAAYPPFAEVVSEASRPDSESAAFWTELLAATPASPSVAAPGRLTAGCDRAEWAVPAALWERLAPSAWGDTLAAALATLACELTGRRAQVIGLPVMNRIGSKAARLPCMHMNIAPLPITVDGSLGAMAQRVAATRKATRRQVAFRYEAMQKALGRERVFGPVLNLAPFTRHVTLGELSGQKRVVCAGPVADLTVTLPMGTGASPPVIEVAAPRGALAVDAARDALASIVEACVAAPTTSAADLVERRLGAARRAAVIGEHRPARDEPLLARLFAAPSATIAVEQGETRITYGELRRRVDAVAAGLLRRGLTRGAQVVVMMDRSPEAIVACLAVLRAGGCYVPMDPRQPGVRLATLKEQVAPFAVLSDAEPLPTGAEALEERGESAIAYVMFTSGSTGRPKGVAVGASALRHFVHAASPRYGITATDRVLQFAPFAFDTSIEEVFVTLASGATLVLRTDAMLASFQAFAEAVAAARITVLDLPTAFWSAWVEALDKGLSHVPASVRLVILGGEAAPPAKLARWLAVAGRGVRLVNSYGPTETTVVVTTAELTEVDARAASLPIGRPLDGVRLLVLDPAGRPADEGELLVLGPTVGASYLAARDEPLRERLRVGDALEPAYRTGDLVRRVGDALVYLGRRDEELKLSGHRVHPQEVEAQLARIPGVVESCVKGYVDAAGKRRLAAFVDGAACLTADAVRRRLKASLPGPMVPSVIRFVSPLPRTPTGKIDRDALVAGLVAEGGADVARGAARDDDAARVRAVWREVLGHDDFTAASSFYEVGGESLQAVQLATLLTQAVGRKVEVADVLRRPVLQDFCAALGECAEEPLRLTPIGVAGAGPRVFVFPGVGGSSAQFLGLARLAAGAARLEVLEPGGAGFASVDEWARAAAELVIAASGAEPLRLLGHSFGGCLAFETARLLERRGAAVELWLLDVFLRRDHAVEKAARLAAPRHGPFDEASLSDQLAMARAYRPTGAFAGRAWRLFAAEASPRLARARDADLPWFLGPTETHELPGDHFSMLTGSNPTSFWELFRRCSTSPARPFG